MAATPDDVIARVGAVQRPLVLVGIGGRGASGKSTLARRLAGAFDGVQIVPTDAFWDGDRFDLERLRHDVVDEVLGGRSSAYDAFDWATRAPAARRTVHPCGIVVIDGVCALHQMFRDDLDVRVWVDAPADVRLARGVARDGEAARSTWLDVWIPGEDAYVERDDPVACAHLVVDGTQPVT
jgi:uridine kinase